MKDKVENKSDVKNNRKKLIKKVVNIIEYTIIFTVILVNAILIFESVHHPNKTPSIFGKKAFVIVSGSMIPEIQIGDVVLINSTDDVKINDVIAFRRDSSVIVHRIIKEMNVKGTVMYQTKGDNNNVADSELVSKSDIEGIMFGKIPFVGRIIMWLYNNLPIVFIFVIGGIIIRYILCRFLFDKKD